MKLNKLVKKFIEDLRVKYGGKGKVICAEKKLPIFARFLLSQAFKEVIPKKRIMNKDNPQYVLGWNAYFYQLKKNIKDYLK